MGIAERTYQMMEHYLEHFFAGLNPREIAAHYNLDPSTVYYHLQEIADKNGFTREELLARPECAHYGSRTRAKIALTPLDPTYFNDRIPKMLNDLHEIGVEVDQLIADIEGL